jgi:hypothetical protein
VEMWLSPIRLPGSRLERKFLTSLSISGGKGATSRGIRSGRGNDGVPCRMDGCWKGAFCIG